MKKLITLAAIVMISSTSLFATNNPGDGRKEKSAPAEANTQAVVVKGNVIDSETSECLAGVALEIASANLMVYTDFDGNFIITDIEPGYYNIIVRYVSYQGHLIENVYLQQGNNTIQPIKLVAN